MSQSSGAALAGTGSDAVKAPNLAALIARVQSAISRSGLYAVLTETTERHEAMYAPTPRMQRSERSVDGLVAAMGRPAGLAPLVRHTPVPRRPMADYADRKRFSRLIPKPNPSAKEVHIGQPIDLTKLRHMHFRRNSEVLGRGLVMQRFQLRRTVQRRGREAALAAPTTGIWPWWTYQSRTIPGIGVAMVNVVNLNFLVTENDVDLPAGGLDLSFRRVYNSQSGHTAQNDDGSTPSVFGNRWTNNLDVHLASSGTGNSRTISLYTSDGARDDYACDITQEATCTSDTPGIYDLLATTQVTNGIACQLQWTKKSGVTYVFDAPYPDCTSNGAGYYGRLLAVYGRNKTFYLKLVYSWSSGDDTNPENLSSITVTHYPDLARLVLTFGYIKGSSPKITELMSLTRPDGEQVNYHYTTDGFLADVDKPGNLAVLPNAEAPPTAFLDGNSIATGNLPETYDITSPGLIEACGPRAAVSIIETSQNPNDGACVDFDYDQTGRELSDWYTRGVLNPTPDDGVISKSIQSGPSTGFVQWDDTMYFNNMVASGCGSATASVMSDALGHYAQWCYDVNSRVFQTVAAVDYFASSTTWLTTSQTWDANNDRTSTTDARGNTTNMAYDANGNLVEVALPKQTVLVGSQQTSERPTYFLDYDSNGYNNLMKFCDPANNANNGWNPNPGPTPCAASGSNAYAKFLYNTGGGNEPYGCVTDSYTPKGYHRSIGYGNSNCGNGLPTSIVGDTFAQQNDPLTPSRTPTLSFNYNSNGTLGTYGRGGPNGAIWQINYVTTGMNQVRSVQDPDGVTSYQCDNLDGSVFYSENSYQHSLDGSPGCPTPQQLANNNATPPKFATAYGYDADGNAVTVMHHHNCPDSNNKCVANTYPSPTSTCNSVSVRAGMTCNFFDGLGRLVEVKLPYDSSADVYQNPWITRYLYDLTGSPHQLQGGGPSFSAYGNLFETQELLPSNPTVTETPALGSVPNLSYAWIKGAGYDGVDRPVVRYAATGASSYTTETLTWDSTAVNNDDITGLLGSDCNSASPPQCQEFDYWPGGEIETFESSDNSSPQRGYSYDADGRVTQITSASHQNPQTYAYGADGNVVSATDASDEGHGANSQAMLTYHRYPDDSESSLDVSTGPQGALNQSGLFSYSYRNDGPLEIEIIDDANISGLAHSGQTTLTYQYTGAARLASRAETGVGAYPSPTPQTTIAYATAPPSGPPIGWVRKEVSPVTNLSSYSYSAEGEITGVSSAGTSGCSGPATYTYSLRGELTLSPGCPTYPSFGTLYANGVSLPAATGFFGLGGTQYTWNDLMAVRTGAASSTCQGSNCFSSTWGYDGAGRLTGQSGPYPVLNKNQAETLVTRTYDAENHLRITQRDSGIGQAGWPFEQVNWGPDGHPIVIEGAPNGSGGTTSYERLHWDGDRPLFTTNSANGGETLDDIKVDVQGDILPGSLANQGYNGLTFYDRGPGGTPLGCHNLTGSTFAGLADGFLGISVPPCTSLPGGPTMPTSTVWLGNPYWGSVSMGDGRTTIGMPRPDGIADGFDIIQGVRSYDQSGGSWTTPDARQGDPSNPASEKSYGWNGNDPMNNIDPSGYDTLALGYWNAIQGTSTYHTFGILFDDDGSIIHVYSFGPAGIFVNNDYSLDMARSLRDSTVYFAGCAGVCSWEGRLNSLYYRWPNYHWVYGLTNSNTAFAWILHMAGLSTTLPQAPPWTPGWKTCSGGPTAWGCQFIPNTPPLRDSVDSTSLDNFLYSIYGGGIDPWLYYCNDCTNHFPGLPQ